MSAAEENPLLDEFTRKEYEFGFTTDIEADKAPPGLNEDIISFISAKKYEPNWMLEWQLEAFRVCSRWRSGVSPSNTRSGLPGHRLLQRAQVQGPARLPR